MNQRVTVIGAGRMGSALAATLFTKGFATTVWNRTAQKAEPLARLGLRVADSVLAAVTDADVVIVNVSDYEASFQVFRHPDIEAALRGKILVQLSSGNPNEAREMEQWARPCGIEYLDGAILSAPMGIGTPQCRILCSGPEEVFNRAKPVLMALSENVWLVGSEIGQAMALEVSVMAAFVMSALFGFLQGYVACEAEDVPVATYVQFVKNSLQALSQIIARIYGKLQANEYWGDQSSLEAWAIAPKEVIAWCGDHGVDHSIADAQLLIFEKAIRAGKGQSDIAFLCDVLRWGSGFGATA